MLEGGESPSVVLLHSEGSFAAMSTPIIDDWMATHHVIAPGLPRLGAVVSPDSLPAIDTILPWLQALIDQMYAAPPALVAHFLDHSIAVRFATNHGDRVLRLVLVDAGGLQPDPLHGEADGGPTPRGPSFRVPSLPCG